MWRREATKSTVSKYYDYVLLYMDNFLVVSDRPGDILLKEIGKHFYVNKYSIGPPSRYLGGKMRKVEILNGQEFWAFGYT